MYTPSRNIYRNSCRYRKIFDTALLTRMSTDDGDDLLIFGKTLQPSATVADYAVLFGGLGLSPAEELKKHKLSDLCALFGLSTSDIEREVKEKYFNDLDEIGQDVAQPQSELNSAKLYDSSSKAEKQGQDDEVIAYWTHYIELANVNNESLSEFFKVEDHVFESIIRSNKDIPIEVLEKIVLFVTKTSCDTTSKHKLIALAEYGLLPKLCQPNYKGALHIYQALVEADAAMVVKYVIMSMFRNKIAIPRPLYSKIDKEMLFSLVMDWMDEELVELCVNTANTLYQLFEKKKQLNEANCNILIKTLEHSVRYKPEDKDIGFFFREVIQKFGWNMDEDQLNRLDLLSEVVQNNFKVPIQALIKDRRNSLVSL